MTARIPRTTASRIIAEICNRRRNSDVRADDLEVRFELDKAFDAERLVSRKLADIAEMTLLFYSAGPWDHEMSQRWAALQQSTINIPGHEHLRANIHDVTTRQLCEIHRAALAQYTAGGMEEPKG